MYRIRQIHSEEWWTPDWIASAVKNLPHFDQARAACLRGECYAFVTTQYRDLDYCIDLVLGPTLLRNRFKKLIQDFDRVIRAALNCFGVTRIETDIHAANEKRNNEMNRIRHALNEDDDQEWKKQAKAACIDEYSRSITPLYEALERIKQRIAPPTSSKTTKK